MTQQNAIQFISRHSAIAKPAADKTKILVLSEWTKRDETGKVKSGSHWESIPCKLASIKRWLGY